MGKSEHVQPFITESSGENGGRLPHDLLEDVIDMVEERVAKIESFRQALHDVLQRLYPSNIVYRELVFKSILQSADALPIPEWYRYSWEQLETSFGDNAALVQIALNEMKMKK